MDPQACNTPKALSTSSLQFFCINSTLFYILRFVCGLNKTIPIWIYTISQQILPIVKRPIHLEAQLKGTYPTCSNCCLILKHWNMHAKSTMIDQPRP